MPILDGVEATRRIVAACLRTRVVVLTTYDHDHLVLDALRAGARGYLLKDDPADEMIRAIHLAQRGESLLQPAVAAKLLSAIQETDRLRRSESPPSWDHPGARPLIPPEAEPCRRESLTERELQILELVAQGASNLRIARHLHLAEGTVKNHLSVVMDKLCAANRTEAVAIARRCGMLS
jgi:DNA-binding NarL/FixJ family response regulator